MSRVPRATLIVVGVKSRVPRANFGCGVAARFRPLRSGTRFLDINRYRRLELVVLQAKRSEDLVRCIVLQGGSDRLDFTTYIKRR